MQLMKTVVRVLEGSSLIDKSIEEIERDFGVKVTAHYNPFPAEQNAKKVILSERIYANLCLEVEGDYTAMRKFSLATVDF